jgi:hypothetical protein
VTDDGSQVQSGRCYRPSSSLCFRPFERGRRPIPSAALQPYQGVSINRILTIDVHVLSAIFALFVGAAGWHYMFYSKAAGRLEGIENASLNLARSRLRRVGGFFMLLLAGFFFAGFWAFDFERLEGRGDAFTLVWACVGVLMLVIVVLALIDLRLTYRLRRNRVLQQQKQIHS